MLDVVGIEAEVERVLRGGLRLLKDLQPPDGCPLGFAVAGGAGLDDGRLGFVNLPRDGQQVLCGFAFVAEAVLSHKSISPLAVGFDQSLGSTHAIVGSLLHSVGCLLLGIRLAAQQVDLPLKVLARVGHGAGQLLFRQASPFGSR